MVQISATVRSDLRKMFENYYKSLIVMLVMREYEDGLSESEEKRLRDYKEELLTFQRGSTAQQNQMILDFLCYNSSLRQ